MTTAMFELFARAVAHDTSPGPGEHRVAHDDPRLAAFMAEVAAPELHALGAATRSDSAGNLIASFGPLTGRELLLVCYPAVHHGNEIEDRLHARSITVDGVEHWVGQGANEGKGSFVAVMAGLARAVRDGVELAGRVAVAIDTEGSSTNHSSTVLFDELGTVPAAALLAIGTQNRVALGHRGRADIILTTMGVVRHSSVAAGLPNPIVDICAAQQAVVAFATEWAGGTPTAGTGRSITPYRLVCGPVAPHTMPRECQLALDCRFLPGDDVDQVRTAIMRAVANQAVDVRFGPVMLPAATPPDSRIVTALQQAGAAAGIDVPAFMPPWTYDAGAAHRRGIPVVLFGPSSETLQVISTEDAVSAQMVEQAAAILAGVIAAW
jgi:acetylornithine deacetylase/succinyl-diaminopimelate desuccinylase-like protein